MYTVTCTSEMRDTSFYFGHFMWSQRLAQNRDILQLYSCILCSLVTVSRYMYRVGIEDCVLIKGASPFESSMHTRSIYSFILTIKNTAINGSMSGDAYMYIYIQCS